MKKVFLTAAILLGGLTTYSTQAQVVTQEEEVTEVVQQEEYKEIKADAIPKAVKDALAADFPTATLNKSYVNDKEEYKLEITVDEVASTVYADKEGNWIKKEE